MNAPTVAPEIKQEAARSLLERFGEKNALVRFFRYNASAKHGVPIDPPTDIYISRDTTTTTTTTQPSVAANGTNQGQNGGTQTQGSGRKDQSTAADAAPQPNISVNVAAPPAATQATGGNDLLKGALYTVATLAGLAGAVAVGYSAAGRSNQPTNQAPTVQQPTTETEKGKIIESPLQFLEDVGAHRPEIVNEQ